MVHHHRSSLKSRYFGTMAHKRVAMVRHPASGGPMVASRWLAPLGTEFVQIFFRPADWQSIQLYLERDLYQPCFSESVGVIPQATD